MELNSLKKSSKTLWSRLRKGTYKLLFGILDAEEISPFQLTVHFLITFVQLMTFVLNAHMDNLADAEHVESVSNVIQWTVLGPSLWKLVPQMQFQLYAISVVLAVLLSLFILVAYQSTRKSSDAKGGRKASLITSKWIFTSFNYTVVFSLTSGFFPVSSIYIYGFKCSDDVTRCWSPEHYANMVISTVFIVYFLWICFIYSVPVCEYFPVSRNALAKFASLFIFPHRIVVTYDFVDYMFKLAMCVNFAFLDISYLTLAILTLYALYVVRRPARFHDNLMNFVERTLSIMYSLSVLMLYVPEVTTLRISGLFGLVLVWTPVILWALWTIYSGYHTLPRTDDEKLLRISANVESDNDGVRAIYEFHRVISNLSQHECRMWIEGYMPMHVEKCAAGENCGLCHYYKKLYSESRKAKVKMGETVAIERKVLDVFKKALIRNLLKVFPRSTELKLAYLFFADSHDHKDQSYIKKITSGDQRNLVLRFALARYESKHKERKSAIERMKNERQAILEVAELLNQFWELFEGDNPEVREVYEIGKRAFEGLELLKRIEKERVAEGIEDTTGAHALYRQLMHDVFLESTEKDAHDVSVDVKHSEEKAWMRFSTKEKYMGTILECNQAFSRLLGYSKSDLIGKSISTLIPRLYLKAEQRLRQSIMDVYWKPAGSDSGTALSAFAKHRSEYVFPIKLVVEKWASAFSSPDMMVSMDIEKKNFNSKVVYFLTDRELVIDSCSSSAITLFSVHKWNDLWGTRLGLYMPAVEQKGWEDIYCTRDGTETELRVGDLPNAVCYANCRCGKLELDMGYWFRLEVEDRPGIRRPPPGAAIESQSSKSVGSLVPDSEIQFDYNEELNLFVRINRAVTPCDSHGSRTPLKSQFTKTSAARGTPRGPDDRSQFQKQQQSYFYVRLMQSISSGHYAGQLHDLYEDLLENSMKKNYGRDVKIYRLIDGEMCPIDEKNSCLVEEAFESDAETNGDTKREDGAKTDAVTVAKKIVSREQFISKMRDSTSRSAAKSLTLAVAGSALAVLLICILEYLLTVQSSADAVYRTKIVIWTFNYIEYLYKANFMVHQLLLGKEAIYYPYSNLSSLIAGEKDSLNDIIDAVSDIEHDYSLDMNVYKERVYVNYTYTYGTTVSILYNQSINYIIGDMMNISASNYTCIAYNYPSVKRFRTVVTGSFADATMKFGYYALDMLSSLNNAKSDAMEALYIATCLVVLFADIIILPFVMSSTGEGRHIINQLLHIPKRVVVKIKDNVTDIINSASGQTKNEEQESKPIEYSVLEMMKLNKRTVHSTSAYFGKLFHIKYYLIPLGVLLLMFEGIALARYMLYLSNTARLNSVLAYYRNIIMLPTICLQALLYQEEYYIDQIGTSYGKGLLNKAVSYLHKPISQLLDVSQYTFSGARLNKITNIETGNLCTIDFGPSSPVTDFCNTSLNAYIAQQGLDIAIAEYTRLLKQLLRSYMTGTSRYLVLSGIQRTLLRIHPRSKHGIVELLNKLILPAYGMKRQLVLEELADAYNYKTNCKNIFFACAIVSIFLIYVCIWAPIIVYVRKKIKIAGCILGLVPHAVLISNPRLVSFLEQRLGILKG